MSCKCRKLKEAGYEKERDMLSAVICLGMSSVELYSRNIT